MSEVNPSFHIPSYSDFEKMAKQAGSVSLSFFRKITKFEEKSFDQGIVTEADHACEKVIKTYIETHFPGHCILAEESGWNEVSRSCPDAVPVWIIDPIDGTTNFSRGNPYFNISIGFGSIQDGKCTILAGMVYQPTTGDLYTAFKGKGAFVNNEPMRVATPSDVRLASVATGFAGNKGEALRKVTNAIHAVQNSCLGTRLNGAAALDLAFVARGISHGFFEAGLAPWDMAAGVLLLEEAGAKVTNYEGNELDVLNDKNIIAASPEFYGKLYSILQPFI